MLVLVVIAVLEFIGALIFFIKSKLLKAKLNIQTELIKHIVTSLISSGVDLEELGIHVEKIK